MKLYSHLASLLVVITVLLAGCDRVHDQPSGGSRVDVSPSSPAADGVRLESLSLQNWPQALAAQQGKIVVVDTWATWCMPCTEEFPKLVALHEKYALRGVVCMSVSVDEPDNQSVALQFLNRHGATFPNYLIDQTAWLDQWNVNGLPFVLVFDRQGTLVKKFDMDDPDNQFTYAEVEKLVEQLVEPLTAAASE